MPASSTSRAILNEKCEPWPTSVFSPLRQRLAHHRMELAVLVDEAAGMAREGMGQDIARPQDLQHVGQDRVGIVGMLVVGQRPELAEMDVERQVERAADLRRAPHRLVAPAREAADLGMALHAAHQVGVLARRPHRVVDGDAVGTIELGVIVALEAAHHVGRDEGEHAARGGLDDELAETREGQHRRPALVDQRRHARVDADHVGVEAEAAADVAIDVRVRVDHARQHELAAHVDRFAASVRADSCRQRRCVRRARATSRMPSRPCAGSMTRPPRSTRS